MRLIKKEFFTEPTKVIDLQIADRHNFAVGKSKIIVHNSSIRPRGAFIHGIGVESPGTVKFMELFDKTSEIITSGSGKKSTNVKAKGKIRKGAMLGTLSVNHKDIIEFITAKQHPGRLTKFNVSVNCTREFMEKVQSEDDDSWDLVFPDTTHENYKTEWDGNIESWKNKGYPVIVHQTVSAKWLWNLIMESTYNRAEPGVLFLDRANEYNPGYYMEKIVATNPCFAGDTLVNTTSGDIPISEIVNNFNNKKEQYVYTFNTKTENIEIEKVVNAQLTSKNAKLIELVFDDGIILHVTPNHKIFTKNRGYVEAQFLSDNDDIIQLTSKNAKVIYKRDINNEDVYDITTEHNHNFFANNILVHNCG